MRRDLERLSEESFDLLVVGGGIHGLCIARDAALRGLVVALVERDDFLSATSANSLKIVHGGLRYLQHGHLRRMRQSIGERRALMSIAPHLVRPLPCVMPTHGWGTRSRMAMAVALAANDLIAFDRNAGVIAERRLGRGRVLGAADYRALDPVGLNPGAPGGALWYDAQMIDSERVALEVMESAVEQGACCANRVAALRPTMQDGRVEGVEAEDRLSGARFRVQARVVVNAAGPWSRDALAGVGAGGPLSVGMNLVLRRRLVEKAAVAVSSRVKERDSQVLVGGGTRLLFFTPWRDRCIAGTTHLRYTGRAEEFRLEAGMIERFLDEINAACPGLRLCGDDVSLVHAGLIPARSGAGFSLLKHHRITDHAADGFPGLLSVIGVKWTTARLAAEQTVDRVVSLVGRPARACATASTSLPGGGISEPRSLLASAEAEARPDANSERATARRLVTRYGSRWRVVHLLAAGKAELLAPLSPVVGTLGVEVLQAVRAEMALTLEDIVRRRTDLGTAGPPDAAALAAAARLAGRELGWDETRRRSEIDAVRALYRMPGSS